MKQTVNDELIEQYIRLKDEINHLTKMKNEIRLKILENRFLKSDKFSIKVMEKKHIDYRKIASDFLNLDMIKFENYTETREYLYIDEKDEDEISLIDTIDYNSIIETAKKRNEFIFDDDKFFEGLL